MRIRRKIKRCPVCGHVFSDRETISQHMASYHPKPDQRCCAGSCASCGRLAEWRAETMKKAHEKADALCELCEVCLAVCYIIACFMLTHGNGRGKFMRRVDT